MAVTDLAITIAHWVKWEAPGGDVRLVLEGGMVDFGGERYEAEHAVFGVMAPPGAIEAGFGDVAEDGQLAFYPNPLAAVSDWWRFDLEGTRVRVWQGEIDADGITAINAKLLQDLQVDTAERARALGQEILLLELIGRQERMFLTTEGNVCSDRFHQTVFAGEKGLANCTDLVGFVPWGAAAPPRGSIGGGSAPGGAANNRGARAQQMSSR